MSIVKQRIAIVGASGYTGSELARILVHHPLVEIAIITSESHVGKKFSDLHPQFLGILDRPLSAADEVLDEDPDLIFLALPHGVSMKYVERWNGLRAKIIDLSGDFRLDSPTTYKEWYKKEHTFPEGFEEAVYGLPEVYEEEIGKARLVANPGCYPTASILSLAPLYKAGMITTGSVIIDAKSGTTGAGIKSAAATHFSNVNENFKAYGISSHRHAIEIEEQFEILGQANAMVQFTPHLLPVDRGILATAYAGVDSDEMNQETLDRLYRDYYKDKPYVRVREELPSIKGVRASNFCDICPVWDERTRRVIVIAVIDNLVKGASGQAVQNMNLMFGFDQTAGLHQLPIQP